MYQIYGEIFKEICSYLETCFSIWCKHDQMLEIGKNHSKDNHSTDNCNEDNCSNDKELVDRPIHNKLLKF